MMSFLKNLCAHIYDCHMSVVKLPPARRSGSVAGVTGACVCDGSGVKWPRVG